jgi:hypothetical protein
MLASISAGRPQNSLGPALVRQDGGSVEFHEAGLRLFKKLNRLFPLKPHHRVVEYGCGSLRVANHVIRYLDPGHFFGLDVVDDFYRMGADLVGPDLIGERRPRLAVISEAAVSDASAFSADLIYSHAVCTHVHPDELDVYFRNLAAIASKPGCVLLFNASISDRPLRYTTQSWTWPMSVYVNALPLRLVRFHAGKPRSIHGEMVLFGTFEFRR